MAIPGKALAQSLRRWPATDERVEHLLFTLETMRDHVLKGFLRIIKPSAMPRQNRGHRFASQPVQRSDIVLHVAVGWRNHHRHAFHDVVAGKQHARRFMQKAQVVERVPRCVQTAHPRAAGGDHITLGQLVVGREGVVAHAL